MTTLIAVDTNILVYAHRTDVEHHAAAKESVERLAGQSANWAIPWPCVHEFLAVTTGRAFGATRTPWAEALEVIGQLLSRSNCVTLGESGRHLQSLAGLCERATLTGGAIHDAKIAAICIDNGVDELWTCDRDFSRFPDLGIRNPLIPSLHEPPPAPYTAQRRSDGNAAC